MQNDDVQCDDAGGKAENTCDLGFFAQEEEDIMAILEAKNRE